MYAKVEIMSIRFVTAFLNADMDQHKGLHESTPWIKLLACGIQPCTKFRSQLDLSNVSKIMDCTRIQWGKEKRLTLFS